MKTNAVASIVSSQALGADFTSKNLTVTHGTIVAVQADVSAGSSPAGNLQLWGRIGQGAFAPISGQSQAVSANGSFVFVISPNPWDDIQLRYVRTSGTATLNAWFRKKEHSA